MVAPVAAPPIYLGRQPILDSQQQLYGYELLFRAGPNPNRALVHDSLSATATVVAYAFGELGLGDALGQHRGFINVDQAFLDSSASELLPKDQVVLEILEDVPLTADLLERCASLRQAGFTLALDDVTALTPAVEALLPLVHIVKVVIGALPGDSLNELVTALTPYPVELLAEQVETREQMERCRALGFRYFQGYYFARPDILTGHRLGHARLSLLKILTQVLDDAETTALESLFKREPGLSINLLRLANSAAVGARAQIDSLRHAITLLGRRQLQRWLQLLLYTDPSGITYATPLLQLAATRARLMEILAGAQQPDLPAYGDKAFLTGILSLTPGLFNLTMEDILAQISNLAEDVRLALLEHHGPLGQLIRLVESLEEDTLDQVPPLLAQIPGLSPELVNQAQTQALAWTAALEESHTR